MVDLHHQIAVSVPRELAYRAVATEEGLRGWWTADSTADQQAGGKATFGFDNREVVFRMTIDELEPPERVRWTCTGDVPEWQGTQLEWDIEEGEGGSVIKFTHRNWREMTDFCASCNSTWGELMWRLRDYLEGREPGPHWTA